MNLFRCNCGMKRQNFFPCVVLLGVFCATIAPVVAQRAAITVDPAPDRTHPATMQAFQIPSHGALLNAFIYMPSGAGAHPTVILLHGFPGNERNLDLAQAIRRAGWNVLYFDYRGSWGSPGAFSFVHCIEDTNSAIAYLRVPSHAAQLHVDTKMIVLVGHSMGGFMALQAGASDPAIRAVIAISAADLGAGRLQSLPADRRGLAIENLAAALAAEGMAPLAGTTPVRLADEVSSHADQWIFVNLAPKFATKSLLAITSDDGWSTPVDVFVEAVKRLGNQKVTAIHFDTDHAYSDHRIALQKAVLDYLENLERNKDSIE